MDESPSTKGDALMDCPVVIHDDHRSYVAAVSLPDVAAYESIVPSSCSFSAVPFVHDENYCDIGDQESVIETFKRDTHCVTNNSSCGDEVDADPSVKALQYIFVENEQAVCVDSAGSGDHAIAEQLMHRSTIEDEDFVCDQEPIYETISTSIEEVVPTPAIDGRGSKVSVDIDLDPQMMRTIKSDAGYCLDTTDEDDYMHDRKPICRNMADPFVVVSSSMCKTAPYGGHFVSDQSVERIKTEGDFVNMRVVSDADSDFNDSVLGISCQVEISATADVNEDDESHRGKWAACTSGIGDVRNDVDLVATSTRTRSRRSRKVKPRKVGQEEGYAEFSSVQSNAASRKPIRVQKKRKKNPTIQHKENQKTKMNESHRQSKRLPRATEVPKIKRKAKPSSTITLKHDKKPNHADKVKSTTVVRGTSKQRRKSNNRDDQVHLCGLCQKTFATFSGLQNHENAHTDVRPHVCEVCGRGFRLAHMLRNHMLTHTGEKPHKCTFCTQRFMHQNTFRRHMKRHAAPREEGKPFQCTLCCRAFTQKRNLLEHMNTHMGIRPYKCTMCSDSFIRKEYLKRHVFSHTGEEMFVCVVCKRDFILETSLEKHMSQFHNINN